MEEEIQQDWDLHAVVRGCTATSSSSASSTTTTSSAAAVQQDFNISSAYLGDLLQPKRETSKQDLLDLCKPFFHSSCNPSEMTILPPRQQPTFSLLNLSKPQKSTPRNKKRKVNMKKVRHVAAEELSSDVWSWRKYGQKPIKGSPYPRGYYRCSTSKGCMARKQVERNRSDPGMFILTYTGDHNHPIPTHRNTSAAGSSFRPKPAAEGAPNLEESTTKPMPKELDTCQPDNDKDDEDNFIPLDDDFFEGLESFNAGECSMDDSPVGFPAISDGGTAGG